MVRTSHFVHMSYEGGEGPSPADGQDVAFALLTSGTGDEVVTYSCFDWRRERGEGGPHDVARPASIKFLALAN
jgi:hypothetical protein